jgi:cobalt/nickel transport system permease protein
MEEQARKDTWPNRLHPLAKLIVTFSYIAVTASFHKYDLAGLLSMCLYPLVVFAAGDLPFGRCLKRIWAFLPALLLVGIWNPFWDRVPVALTGQLSVPGGVLSMVSLMWKGVFAVLAAYLLLVTTGMDKICGAFRMAHVPAALVTVILFTYRYAVLLLREALETMQAYSLRAPGQKGVHYRAWGSMAGQLLLRTMDRAARVYESMCLRGYAASGGNGEAWKDVFFQGRYERMDLASFLWLAVWTALFFFLRLFPLFRIVGSLVLSG